MKQIEFLEDYRSLHNNINYNRTIGKKTNGNRNRINNNRNHNWTNTNKNQHTKLKQNGNGKTNNNNNNTTNSNSNSDINSILSNAESYIDQMHRKIQFMNEEMIDMRNLNNIKIDIITQEFNEKQEIQLQEISILKQKLEILESSTMNKKRDSIDSSYYQRPSSRPSRHSSTDSASQLKFTGVPSFQMKQTTMTPSPASSSGDEDEEDPSLAMLRLDGQKNFTSWTKRPAFEKTGSAMTPSPPGSPSSSSNRAEILMQRAKKQKEKEKIQKQKQRQRMHHSTHSSRMASIPEFDDNTQKEIEKEIEKETLRMVRKLGTFGNDDSSSSDSGSDVGNARAELMGDVEFAVTVSNGNMTPSPTREAAMEFAQANGE